MPIAAINFVLSCTPCRNKIMKLPKVFGRKKLRATTARRSLGVPDEMDYEQMSEPNMKLSRALLIVLVLHVVAVAGIIAFNTIKSRQGPPPPLVSGGTGTASATQSVPAKPASVDAATTHHENTVVARVPAKPSVKEERKALPVKPSDTVAKPDNAKTYVVAKGDNPVTIARKFKVSYDDLLVANHIDDPHKLKIGQKLIIPTKVLKAKKASE